MVAKYPMKISSKFWKDEIEDNSNDNNRHSKEVLMLTVNRNQEYNGPRNDCARDHKSRRNYKDKDFFVTGQCRKEPHPSCTQGQEPCGAGRYDVSHLCSCQCHHNDRDNGQNPCGGSGHHRKSHRNRGGRGSEYELICDGNMCELRKSGRHDYERDSGRRSRHKRHSVSDTGHDYKGPDGGQPGDAPHNEEKPPELPTYEQPIVDIPICQQLAFFDNPFGCGPEIGKSDRLKGHCGKCIMFTVDTKTFRIDTNASNNKDLENNDTALYFISEDSEVEDTSVSVGLTTSKGQAIVNENAAEETLTDNNGIVEKVDRTCNTFSLNCYNNVTANPGGDCIQLGNRQWNKTEDGHFQKLFEWDLTFTNPTKTTTNIPEQPASVAVAKEDETIKAWTESLRRSEVFPKNDFVSESTPKVDIGKNYPVRPKKSILKKNYEEKYNVEYCFTNSKGTKFQKFYDKDVRKRKNDSELETEYVLPYHETSSSFKSSGVFLTKPRSPTRNVKMFSHARLRAPSNSVTGSFDDMLENQFEKDYATASVFSEKKSRRKKFKSRNNFIRKNILEVKCYQTKLQQSYKNISTSSPLKRIESGKLDRLSAISEHPLQSFQSKTKNKKTIQNVDNGLRNQPRTLKFDLKVREKFSEKNGRLPSRDKKEKIAIPCSSTDRALIVNPQTGSVSSIRFTLDDDKASMRTNNEFCWPVINTTTERGCENPNYIGSYNDHKQKEVFQIKGFLYETVGNNKETLYVSYDNLKKLIQNNSKNSKHSKYQSKMKE